MKYLWENLQVRAILAFRDRMFLGSSAPAEAQFLALIAATGLEKPYPGAAKEILKEWEAYGVALIENWDIRKCMKLVECFPEILPKRLHSRTPVCDYDENLNWALFFD